MAKLAMEQESIREKGLIEVENMLMEVNWVIGMMVGEIIPTLWG